jgi:TolB-like protein/class 3 adenylate cyclase
MVMGGFSGKLAVILHADVAGSTSLVQQDKELAHERIQDSFQRFGDTIETYHGRMLELRGDALLASFDRASDAVSAAITFQTAQAGYIENLQDDVKPNIRVGISMGEVVIADNTVTGAGVVQAQRIEQLANPGTVCISAAIHEALSKRTRFELDNLGEQALKGLEHPVHVYRIALKPGESIPPSESSDKDRVPGVSRWLIGTSMAVLVLIAAVSMYWLKPPGTTGEMDITEQTENALLNKPSIVVLPFTNMSNDVEQEYFVDGMTEDLITDLSKISALTVISRMSSFSYKGRSPDVGTVSRDLGVSHLIEGSVRKVGKRIRISAQLVDATGAHIWADRYDREINDIFALQDEVREKIITALAIKLTAAEEERLARPLTNSVEAYELYLRALQQISFFNREANLKSQEMFKQAIELDPEFATAYSYLAQAYSLAVENEWADNRDELIKLTVTTARRGIEIDPELPFAHWSLGRIYSRAYLADMQRSLAAFEKSIALDPNYADGYVMLASAQIYVGQAENALGNIEQGMRLNPHFPFWYIHTLGQAQFALTRYEAAEESFKKAIARNPAVGWPRRWLVATYGQLGKLDDAEWEISELEGLGQPFTIEMFKNRLPLQDPEYLKRLLGGARKAGVPES